MSRTDPELDMMMDIFDDQAFLNAETSTDTRAWAIRKYGSIEDARFDIMRDEQDEPTNDEEAF